jgi:phenylacetic acid degradation operon negative regulatory protein
MGHALERGERPAVDGATGRVGHGGIQGGLGHADGERLGGFAGYARHPGKPLDDTAAFVTRTRLAHRFREFASLDPELPGDVGPRPCERGQAVALLHQLYAALQLQAQRHFDEVTTP